MNTNQETRGNFDMPDLSHMGPVIFPSEENYTVINVSNSDKMHNTLFKTLKHFSLNGRGINLIHAKNLPEARKVAERHRELVLVIIDENVVVNGSYKVFVDFVRNDLKNHQCCITFKQNLLRSDVVSPLHNNGFNAQPGTEFFYTRERLIDITRMILLTNDMESKISASNLATDDQFNMESTDEDSNPDSAKITSDKIYNAIAHDLKEPVASIKVILDFLTNEPELLDKESSKDLLYRMRESANNVHEMLEDFLFWTRMFKQDIYYNPTKVSIAHVVRGNMLLLKSTASEKGISLVSGIPEDFHVNADEYMISTVFRNLLYNAIKYSDENAEIYINAKSKTDCIEISVQDIGNGLPSELLRKLFEAKGFQSLKGMIKDAGTGLGLILCRDFIEKNGGSIKLIGKDKNTTEILISLPAWD